MPTYKYRCEECGEVIEISRKMKEEKTPDKCNKCGSTKLSRIFSPVGVSVKGTSSCPDGTCQRFN